MASEIVLSCGETLQRRKTKEAPSLGGIPPRAAAEFAQNTEVILTACIAGIRIGLAGLVRRGKITALFGGFGGDKIGGNRPRQQEEENHRNNVRHRGPRLMLAARSNLLRFESKFRPTLYPPPLQ